MNPVMAVVLFILSIFVFSLFASTPVGKFIVAGILLLLVFLAVFMIHSTNKESEKQDREKYKDEDKPYMTQRVTNRNYFADSGSSPRWWSWLVWFVPGIVFGLIIFLDK